MVIKMEITHHFVTHILRQILTLWRRSIWEKSFVFLKLIFIIEDADPHLFYLFDMLFLSSSVEKKFRIDI